MPSAIETDKSQGLLVVIRFLGLPSESEFRQYLDDYAQMLREQTRFGTVFVTAPSLPMMPPRHARMQAQFIREHREEMIERVVCIAFALPTALMRGVLRGVFMLEASPSPYTVVSTEAEGVAWVKARLWTDHVRRMKGVLA
jgi:hypothetical protein